MSILDTLQKMYINVCVCVFVYNAKVKNGNIYYKIEKYEDRRSGI